MNIAKFFLCFLITGTPLFYVDAMEEQVQAEASITRQSKVAPLIELATDVVAKAIFKEKEDLFVLLRTRYKELPDECKAGIIAAYSKLVPGDQILSVVLNCVQMSDLAMFDAHAKMLLSKTELVKKRDGPIEIVELVADALTLARKELYEKNAVSQQSRQGLDMLSTELSRQLPSFDDVEHSQALPLQAWKTYLTGEATRPRVACILGTVAPSCVFARTALEIIHYLASHDFFEDQAIPQPLTRVCLLEKEMMNRVEELPVGQRIEDHQLPVEIVKDALVVLLPENDWVHAVRQLIMEKKCPALGIENERLALALLSEGIHVRNVSKGSLVELYFWSCIFDMKNIIKFIEEKFAEHQVLARIKKLYGSVPITLSDRDDDYTYEYMRAKQTLGRDLLVAACNGDYRPILCNLEKVRDLSIPFPCIPPVWTGHPGLLLYDLLDFACKMGYTRCVDALLAADWFSVPRDFDLEDVLNYGRKGLVSKLYDYENRTDNMRPPLGKVFKTIYQNQNGIKGRHEDALKVFIDRTILSPAEEKIFDLAWLLANAAHWENKEILDYLIRDLNSENCCLEVDEKQELLGTALCIAVSVGTSLTMVKRLVESGAPLNPWPQKPEKPRHADDYQHFVEVTGHVLYDALERAEPDIEVVRYLLSQGAIDEAFKYGGASDTYEYVSAYGLAQQKRLHALAELLRPVFVEHEPTGEQTADEPGDWQSEDEQ